MESILLELSQAVIMGCTYSNLKKTGHIAYEGLSIQLKEQKNVEVHLGDLLFATGLAEDPNKIQDSIDWTILNTNPGVVGIFHTKASKMGIDLIKEYGNY